MNKGRDDQNESLGMKGFTAVSSLKERKVSQLMVVEGAFSLKLEARH